MNTKMNIFRQPTDWVIVCLNNNGCAYIEIEGKAIETSYSGGECWVRAAREAGYREIDYTHYDNGDVRYIFN